MSALIEKVIGDIGDKRRWRGYRARVRALPPSYRAAVEALERYLTHRAVITRGDVLVDLHVELVEVFERAASRGTSIREVVGADPVHFADTLLREHAAGSRIDGERELLAAAIAGAAAEDGGRS